jgi:virginiamycin B lyase
MYRGLSPRIAAAVLAIVFGSAAAGGAAPLPGTGEIGGSIAATNGEVVTVYLHNAQRSVGYAVFAVDGTYRAPGLFPGRYSITVRHNGLEMAPVPADVAAGGRTRVDLSPRRVPPAPNYTGGHTLPGVQVEPYDSIYPAGAGRQIVERTCIVCHGVNFLPGKRLDRAGWQAFVNYMAHETAFRSLGMLQGPSLMDPKRIGATELPVLLDYLAANFGPRARPRAVLQEREPVLDRTALAKAMYIEYRQPNTPAMPKRWTQEPHFDRDGNVWVTDRGQPAALVRIDPRTGASKDFPTPDPKSSPHGLAVDADGTVWWAGRNNFLAHLDPKTGLTDQYPVTELGLHGHTPVFDSKGDLWLSMLPSNKLGHWDRETDHIAYWETPSPRGHPYGLVVDFEDKVWYVEYYTDHVVRFDPATAKFRRYPIKSSPAALRRLGVDSLNIVWFGVYGRVGKEGKLGRLDPKTGEVVERTLPIQYSNPYDAWPDDFGNVWVSCDNYLVRFREASGTFTVYPVPERTDQPKMMVTRDGAVWFTPRAAGVDGGYGGGASVLYPDKDAIATLGAYYSTKSSANHLARWTGAPAKVTGATKRTRHGEQNPQMPGPRFVGRPVGAPAATTTEGRLVD